MRIVCCMYTLASPLDTKVFVVFFLVYRIFAASLCNFFLLSASWSASCIYSS